MRHADLISSATIRTILNRYMKLEQSYHLDEIYHLIQDHYDFSATDLKPYRGRIGYKHWEHQVDNVLSRAKAKNHVYHEYNKYRRKTRRYTRLHQLG